MASRCKNRNLLPIDSSTLLKEFRAENSPREGKSLSNSSYDLRRKNLSKMLNLDFLFFPKRFTSSYYKRNSLWHHAATHSNGVLINHSITSPPKGGEQSKIKRFEIKDVNLYHKRVAKLSWLLHIIVQNGLNKRAIRHLKRLNLVAFTTRYTQFVKIVNLVARTCNFRYDKLATNPRGKPLRGKPSFTGEKKSIKSLNGYQVPLWTYEKVVKPSDDEW